MAEIFKEAQAFNEHPNRWNHDLSHKIYGSFKYGTIYPVMTELMCPTDSVKLDIAAMLQFMPTATPLQSRSRVIFHVFFQRLKNVHKDFPNMIEQLEEHEIPYIMPSVKEFVPGSIHDYLGVNVVKVVHGNLTIPLRLSFANKNVAGDTDQWVYLAAPYDSSSPVVARCQYTALDMTISSGSLSMSHTFSSASSTPSSRCKGVFIWSSGVRVVPTVSVTGFDGSQYAEFKMPSGLSVTGSSNVGMAVYLSDNVDTAPRSNLDLRFISYGCSLTDDLLAVDSSALVGMLDELGYDGSQYIHYCPVIWFDCGGSSQSYTVSVGGLSYSRNSYGVDSLTTVFVNNSVSLADVPDACPYATVENPDAPIKLRAYRHRVYESVYNTFYRNINGNQPFKVNGVTQYNKYNTTVESGLDETTYHLFNRNYELDAYTSCLPRPQQGTPPMVGVSATGRIVIEDDEGNRSTAQLEDISDGKMKGISVTRSNMATDEHRQVLLALSSSGFTINDLRETNALQKFLETNIRKGFRYVEFIKGHFGKGPKHYEMDMPEFLGGFSIPLEVGKVTNTNAAASSSNENDVLGSFAGSAQAFGSSKHKISYFADDYGYLMVTMTIVPDTAYSQVLPKDFLYSSPLDFPFPDFSNLGYQPITYEEFCPIEAYLEQKIDEQTGGTSRITDVFGYQRPQHELIWRPDTLHGQFLTTMNNYAIARWFNGRPELGNSFLQISPSEAQSVFTVTKADNDIAFGQVAFGVTMKRPVPRIVLPSIGR